MKRKVECDRCLAKGQLHKFRLDSAKYVFICWACLTALVEKWCTGEID